MSRPLTNGVRADQQSGSFHTVSTENPKSPTKPPLPAKDPPSTPRPSLVSTRSYLVSRQLTVSGAHLRKLPSAPRRRPRQPDRSNVSKKRYRPNPALPGLARSDVALPKSHCLSPRRSVSKRVTARSLKRLSLRFGGFAVISLVTPTLLTP
jgi:hypothetical protein